MFSAISKNAFILAIVAMLAVLSVSGIHELTKDNIQQMKQQQLVQSLQQVIPTEIYDNTITDSCFLVTTPALGTTPREIYRTTLDGQPSALALNVETTEGYNGRIELLIGINYDGTLLSTRVLSHNETPGLGDKIDLNVSDWILSLADKKLTAETENQWAVRKDGGQFDQFTGATVTPRAVVKAVKNTMLYYQQNRDAIWALTQRCGE